MTGPRKRKRSLQSVGDDLQRRSAGIPRFAFKNKGHERSSTKEITFGEFLSRHWVRTRKGPRSACRTRRPFASDGLPRAATRSSVTTASAAATTWVSEAAVLNRRISRPCEDRPTGPLLREAPRSAIHHR